ncbi:hypothetical protein AMTR_s00006p00201570 [Amborella trichopoda]|uniref:Uncharacterized protein n=1 Tax=Amborella trichopoda TaxID=13333 RepID=W1PCM2_AMBTC|nr:hypothetical protein AMTR_s00006p00201570 [Amborella trichopoda]
MDELSNDRDMTWSHACAGRHTRTTSCAEHKAYGAQGAGSAGRMERRAHGAQGAWSVGRMERKAHGAHAVLIVEVVCGRWNGSARRKVRHFDGGRFDSRSNEALSGNKHSSSRDARCFCDEPIIRRGFNKNNSMWGFGWDCGQMKCCQESATMGRFLVDQIECR